MGFWEILVLNSARIFGGRQDYAARHRRNEKYLVF